MLDARSLEDLKARKPEAIAAAVREHSGDLFRAALGLGLPETDAEELVQQTFAAFLDAASRFEGRSSLRTYLFGILYRKALEHRRLKGRELAVDPADEVFEGRFARNGHWSSPPLGPEQEADVRETAALLDACLEGLPPRQKAAFQLRDVLQEDGPAVCNVLGVSDTHLRVLLFRARAKLRECIEGKWKPG